MTPFRKNRLFFLLVLLATLTVGPGAAPPGAIAEAAKAEAPPPPIRPVDTAPLKVPAKIAALCPAYPGAAAINVIDKMDIVRTMFRTDDDPAKVSAYYKKELTQRGWRLVHEDFSDGARLVLQKDSEQVGFGAHLQRRSGFVTFFISMTQAKADSQDPTVQIPKSPARQ